MITLEVTSVNGAPATRRIAAQFDELGGSIGRGDVNTLVLPDPEKVISRTHANVRCRAGEYKIEDRGTAVPVHLNGQPLGNGREATIRAGDVIQIGPYALRVSATTPAARAPIGPTGAAHGSAGSGAAPKDDPLAMFGGGGVGASNPFGDLLGHAARPARAAPPSPDGRIPEQRASRAAPAAQAPSAAGGMQRMFDDPFAEPASMPRESRRPQQGGGAGIPDDFDPFAPTPRAGHGKIPDDMEFSLGSGDRARDGNINDLFGLGAGPSDDPFGPGHPLGDPSPVRPGGTAAHAQRNDTPEIHAAFQAPVARPDPLMAWRDATTGLLPLSPLAPANPPASMFVSWDANSGSSTGEIRTVIIPAADSSGANAAPPRRPADAAPPRPQAPPTAAPTPPSSAAPARASSTAPAAPPAAGADALLRAFLDGAGVPDLKMAGQLTPQLMQVFGQLLREATQGTLDLLVARSIVKREMRAQATMIAARENNPLKFSPNVEAALSHLLNPQARGFMSPLRAMRDAYDDLRAHQFAVMTGMEAAIAAVLGRFRPAELELRLAAKSLIDSMLPMNRKAKLWDLFEDRYGELARELEDDFHTLFGKEFLRAYEEQLDKLDHDSAGQRKG